MSKQLSRRKFIKSSVLTAGVFTIVPRHVLGRGFIAPSDKITMGLIGCGRQRKVATRLVSETKEGELLVYRTKIRGRAHLLVHNALKKAATAKLLRRLLSMKVLTTVIAK